MDAGVFLRWYLVSDSAPDQPLHKRMRHRNMCNGLDLVHLEDAKIRFPPMKEKERVIVGAQMPCHAGARCGLEEHAANRWAIDIVSCRWDANWRR